MGSTQTTKRRPSLYRTVLSLWIAAVIATALPFTVIAVSAFRPTPTVLTAAGAPRLLTSASGSTAATASPGATATGVPVTTRTSARAGAERG